MASPRLSPADRTALEAELTRLNLRHVQWLAIAGNLFLWGIFVLVALYPFPAAAEVNLLNGLLCLNGLGTLACLWLFRVRPPSELWRRVLVLENAVALLGIMGAYYFAMLPAYGSTSVYVIGLLVTAAAFRFPPRVLWGLLLLTHAGFLAVLFRAGLDRVLITSAATDFSGVVVLAGVIGQLLYRAHLENFRNERTIMERNRELARLHQFELDEKISAKLAEEKTRLEMLRYQLNPHFLYNALNSIRALIFSRPPAAGEMVSQLADLCRVTLTRNEDAAPLSEEFAMLKLYLDMEKTRWRDKLAVEIDLAPDAAVQKIPPFLLLPLVENALKHGRQGATGVMNLRLSARVGASLADAHDSMPTRASASDAPASSLLLEVANTGSWLEPGQSIAPSTGIGLENLRQRLKRYYPAAHELTTTEQDGWVVVRLRLPRVATAVRE